MNVDFNANQKQQPDNKPTAQAHKQEKNVQLFKSAETAGTIAHNVETGGVIANNTAETAGTIAKAGGLFTSSNESTTIASAGGNTGGAASASSGGGLGGGGSLIG